MASNCFEIPDIAYRDSGMMEVLLASDSGMTGSFYNAGLTGVGLNVRFATLTEY